MKNRSLYEPFKPSDEQSWSDATDEVAARDAKGRTFYEWVCYFQKMVNEGKLEEAEVWEAVNRKPTK